MKNDVVFRSEVLKAIEDELWLSDSAKAAFRNILVHVPAVDAETLFQQMGLVKEAFDMAKADLVPVVRCKDCMHRYEMPDGWSLCNRKMAGMIRDSDFCSYGERR